MGRKGMFIFAGDPGVGKSTAVAEAFPNSIYIMSAPNILQFFENEVRAKRRGWTMPIVRHIIESKFTATLTADENIENVSKSITIDPTTKRARNIDTSAALTSIMGTVIETLVAASAAGQPPPFTNVIIDEINIFWDRIFPEIKTYTKTELKNPDERAAFGQLAQWSRQMIEEWRTVVSFGANLVCVAHTSEGGDGKKAGPIFPSDRVKKIWCADVDAVMMREYPSAAVMSGPAPPPIWKCVASAKTLTKARGLSSEELSKIADKDLKTIITAMGFDP